MPSIKSLSLCGIASLFMASAATAQTRFDPTGSWIVGGGVEQVVLDRQQASKEMIDDTAVSVYVEGEYIFSRFFSTSFGLAYYDYDDYATFTQWTEDSWGDERRSRSDAQGVPVYAEVGYKQFFSSEGRVYITARGGLALMLASERSISNCSNCYEEDIDIEGGAYGVLGAGVRLASSFLLSVRYKHFFSGDIEHVTGLNFSYSF